jgi:peroxiredoxin
VILLALIILEGWILFQTLRQHGRLLLRLEALEERLAETGLTPPANSAADSTLGNAGLPVGTQAPTFALPGLHGETLTLEALRANDKPVLLLFSDPGCGPCNALLPEIGRWQRDYSGKLTLAVISRGTPDANLAKSSEHGITQVLVQKDREVSQSYQAYGTPSAVLVRPDGTIGTPLAQGADAIRSLVAGAAGLPVLRSLPMATQGNGGAAAPRPQPPAGPRIGDPAPQFSLPDLSGKQVSLSEFRGGKTLVLFWRPSCGFCQRMLDDLKAWETNPPKDAPKLLVVSTDSVEDNKAMGLRAPVLLDQGMSVGKQFGAGGTPMAMLVDAEGRIASELAAGAPAVLQLAGVEKEPAR